MTTPGQRDIVVAGGPWFDRGRSQLSVITPNGADPGSPIWLLDPKPDQRWDEVSPQVEAVTPRTAGSTQYVRKDLAARVGDDPWQVVGSMYFPD